MVEKQAFWMRFYKDNKHFNIAVVADSLDDAFLILEKTYNISNENIFYRNRQLTVLVT